ncbi:hypothetical protein [Streptomyces inhibens]|uniref:hypothetical protein n=1 Tax=Streptomyces inhibens TaxID=2293571 RepID=UPI0015F29FA5|nr:hypothetical protein [Streptomyces inhibens]
MVKALKTAARNGSPVSVSGIARQADLAHAQARNTRLVTRLQQSGQRLSEVLGERVAGDRPGRPAAIGELQRKITRREQCNVEPAASLEDREAELGAARDAGRRLTRALDQRNAREQRAGGRDGWAAEGPPTAAGWRDRGVRRR